MRLLFAARAIDRMAGGVERMIITIMNAMIERGHDVELLTWDCAAAEAFYPMSPRIRWHRLDLGDPAVKATPRQMLERASAVRQLVARSKPQTIVAFQDGPFRALRAYCTGLGIPLIAAERNAPTRFDHTSKGQRRKFIIFNSFRFAQSIVVQCESYRKLYPSFLRKRIVAIPNPVFPARLSARPDRPDTSGRYRLLSVGRLSYQKNYECSIGAFSRIVKSFPQWDLTIIGDGELRGALESMIASASLSGRVTLPGTVADPSEHYAAAHLFYLSSRWEGFPNALAEAQAHGLPAVGFAECAGVNELILDGQNGNLAKGNGDSESLANAFSALMTDNELRLQMGSMSRRTITSFTPEQIMDRWENIFAWSTGNNEIVRH